MNKDEKFLYLTGYAAKAEEMEKAEEAHQFSERFERRQQEIIQKAAECEKQHTGKRRKNRKKMADSRGGGRACGRTFSDSIRNRHFR